MKPKTTTPFAELARDLIPPGAALLLLLAGLPVPSAASPRASVASLGELRTLRVPDVSRSNEMPTRNLAGVTRVEGRVFVIAQDDAQLLTTPFRDKAATREERFGKMVDTVRHPLPGSVKDKFAFTGVVRAGSSLLALNGTDVSIAALDLTKLHETAVRSLPVDTIRPPRDRGGEPTTVETTAMRQKLRRELVATPGIKMTGIAPLPGSWGDADTRRLSYLVSTRIPGFPLVILGCDKDEPSRCLVERGCFVEGLGDDVRPQDITGIAVSAKEGLILIGDRRGHRLIKLHFHSCFHVTRVGQIVLPPRIKDLGGLAIDDDGLLWVTTRAPDDYDNASLYYWESKDWK